MYECKECLNLNTPLCKCCNIIESPSGKLRKPTYYMDGKLETISFTPANEHIKLLSDKISQRLTEGTPIYLSWIIQYNQILTTEKNIKKTGELNVT